MQLIEDLLESHGLKKTSPRMDILNVFMKKHMAITHNDIEEALGKDFDRVTIYRTLNAFEEKGLVHKIMPSSGEAKYALCSSDCQDGEHHDTHAHFNCNNCGSIYCLNEVQIPVIKLPKGFQFTSYTFIAEGTCNKCMAKTELIIKEKPRKKGRI